MRREIYDDSAAAIADIVTDLGLYYVLPCIVSMRLIPTAVFFPS